MKTKEQIKDEIKNLEDDLKGIHNDDLVLIGRIQALGWVLNDEND